MVFTLTRPFLSDPFYLRMSETAQPESAIKLLRSHLHKKHNADYINLLELKTIQN